MTKAKVKEARKVEVVGIPVTPIKGYRQISQEEIDLVNEGKDLALKVRAFCERIAARPDADQRWLAVGKTDLQKGFMAIYRSVMRPEGF